MTLAPWASRASWASRKKVFFTSQIASPTLNLSTIWLVGRRLTLATLRWNRNRVYSSVTSTLATLHWRERHIVNQALRWHHVRCTNIRWANVSIVLPHCLVCVNRKMKRSKIKWRNRIEMNNFACNNEHHTRPSKAVRQVRLWLYDFFPGFITKMRIRHQWVTD